MGNMKMRNEMNLCVNVTKGLNKYAKMHIIYSNK